MDPLADQYIDGKVTPSDWTTTRQAACELEKMTGLHWLTLSPSICCLRVYFVAYQHYSHVKLTSAGLRPLLSSCILFSMICIAVNAINNPKHLRRAKATVIIRPRIHNEATIAGWFGFVPFNAGRALRSVGVYIIWFYAIPIDPS